MINPTIEWWRELTEKREWRQHFIDPVYEYEVKKKRDCDGEIYTTFTIKDENTSMMLVEIKRDVFYLLSKESTLVEKVINGLADCQEKIYFVDPLVGQLKVAPKEDVVLSSFLKGNDGELQRDWVQLRRYDEETDEHSLPFDSRLKNGHCFKIVNASHLRKSCEYFLVEVDSEWHLIKNGIHCSIEKAKKAVWAFRTERDVLAWYRKACDYREREEKGLKVLAAWFRERGYLQFVEPVDGCITFENAAHANLIRLSLCEIEDRGYVVVWNVHLRETLYYEIPSFQHERTITVPDGFIQMMQKEMKIDRFIRRVE